jgi:cytosine/adenosine deaminase-related metal-dependent hydrolase
MQGRLPPGDDFGSWMRGIVALTRQPPDPSAVRDAIRSALDDARARGTGLFGDVSNTLVTVAPLDESGLAAHVFHELIGFNAPDPEGQVREARARLDRLGVASGDVRVSLAPHAPYSVAPRLFAAIRQDLDRHPGARSSVHIGESHHEVEFLLTGQGGIRGALEAIGAWSPDWQTPACAPVVYMDQVGFVDARVLVVHGVQLTDAELQRLAEAGAVLVTCPRSNRWTGAGAPPIDRFYRSRVRVAIGTDSLASVDDLDMFAEMAAVRALAPAVPASRILESATRIGAEALGFGNELGTIEPGKRAALLAVRIPRAVQDVEEYLLSGIDASDIRWLSAA